MKDIGFNQVQKHELQHELQKTIKPLVNKLLEHDRRFECIEEQLKRIDLLPTKQDFLDLMDKYASRVLQCEQEHLMMDSRINRCEERLGFA